MNTSDMRWRASHFSWGGIFMALILAVLLTSCASAPKKAELNLSMQAAADVNPDLQGRPSPVILHIMELRSVEQFNSLDYMGITNASALGAELISRNQVILSPGASRSMPMELDPGTAYLGLVAGYRDIDNATWRVAVAIDQERHRSVTASLMQSQLSATAQ